jgi:phosphoribosyl isomerase A
VLSLIPVLDLMRGHAVRAIRGERLAYQPLRTALCPHSDPVDVACRLLAAAARWPAEPAAAPILYIADLDALMGGLAQVDVLTRVLDALPRLHLWLDAGYPDLAAAQTLRARLPPAAARRVRWVFASESLRDTLALQQACARVPDQAPGALLSLDRRGDERLDRAGCWQHPEWWPDELIVMTLDRVGAGAGPDLAALREVHRLAPQARLVGAGGVRGAADLAAAQAAGAQAWLVASALHDLQLP